MYKEFYAYDELENQAQITARKEFRRMVRGFIREVMNGVREPEELEQFILEDFRLEEMVTGCVYTEDGTLLKDREELKREEWRTGLVRVEGKEEPILRH